MLLKALVRRALSTAVVVCLTIAMAGCGGGGGGGSGGGGGGGQNPPPGGNNPPSSGYTGATNQATVSQTTAPRLAGALIFELGYGFGDRPVAASAAVLGPRQPGALKSIASRARTVARRAKAQAATVENCSEGGTVDIDDRTGVDGRGVVVLTFAACREVGVVTNGTVEVRIDAYDAQRDSVTDSTYRYEDFTLTAGEYITELEGTIRYVDNLTGYTTTFNTVARYRPENIQHSLVNMVVDSVYLVTEEQQSLHGRFYHSTHGYVDVDTTNSLFVDMYSGVARMGALRLRGANAAVVYLEFDGVERIRLSLDANGDGIAERATLATPSTLLLAANQPPLAHAGEAMSVDQGGTVVLDGSGSLDWEGDAITYMWSFGGGPGAVDSLPVQAAQTTVTLTEDGQYAFQLTVTDSAGNSSTDVVLVDVLPNAAPVAQAGENRHVVANMPVTIVGSATDAESDPIQYRWDRNLSPAGSTAPDTVTGATLSFTPDAPGTYSYTLRAFDQYGYSEDTVEIIASPLLSVGFLGGFYIAADTPDEELTRSVAIEVSSFYAGPPVALSVSSNAAWLEVVSAPATTSSSEPLVVRVDLDVLETLDNGEYAAAVTVEAEEFGASTAESMLNFRLPLVTHMVPYVVYTGTPSEVTLYGESLVSMNRRTLTIGGAEVPDLATHSDNFGRVTLPALPAGEYTISIDNELGVARSMARLVVRDPPEYVDGDVELGGALASVEYDAERDAFFVATSGPNQLHRLRYRDGAWETELVTVPSPLAASLNATGDRLYVTTSGCGVVEVDADTLDVLDSSNMSSCYIENLGFVAGIADGRVLVADTDQWSGVFSYPNFETSGLLFPSVHSAHAVLNYARDRLIWAEGPTISPPNELYLFDIHTGLYEQIIVNDASTYFLRNLLAISGDGSTVLHRGDVYVEGQFVGLLEGVSDPYAAPAVTMRGDRAVVFEPSTQTLSLFSLDDGPTFSRITVVAILNEVDAHNGAYILPTDDTVLVFGVSVSDSDPNVYRMYLRNLPD